jgi:tetratricopeptide (TPR) repeat protein
VSARVTHLDDLPALPGPPTWRPVRTELGVAAFGVNAFSAAAAGDLLIEEHDEASGGAGRHEELYVVVRGHARFTVDGEEIDAPAGTLVFVPDPASRRVAFAVEGDTMALVVGGAAGEAFAPSPWEGAALAVAFAQQGQFERALELAREAAREHPDKGPALYNVACAESLAGEREAALEHLRRAFELEPRAREWAARDADLDPLRDDPGFPE